MFHHVDHARQVGARVQQTQRAFQRIRMRAFLYDGCAFAIVFADHNQRPADHAGRSQIRQSITGHVGTDNGFPSDRAAQGVVDTGAEHGRSRGFVGAGFDMHTELLHQGFGLHHHVQQMRHRCALVTADIGYTGLQQGFGHRQYAFAVKTLAVR